MGSAVSAIPQYGILEVADRLGLDYTKNGNAKCPFCEDTRHHLHMDIRTNTWRCPLCNASGGVLHLYARYNLGIEKLPRDRAGKAEVARSLREFMGDGELPNQAPPIPRRKEKPVPDVPVASDHVLNVLYRNLAEFPHFSLSAEHRNSLLARGLSADSIARNGYRTIPESFAVPKEVEALYESLGGDTLRKATFSYHYPRTYVLMGLCVARWLEAKNLSLQGIPGFFRFGKCWCLYYKPGILIPTRNILGEIVGYQVRQKAAPKYVTLSCSSMPGAVNGPVSRCHFPLGNCTEANALNGEFCFTEGPLKADVAIDLLKSKAFFVAIPGINTTKDFLRSVPTLQGVGFRTAVDCLDMDKFTNPNVAAGDSALVTALEAQRMTVKPLHWGKSCAEWKALVFVSFARAKGVKLPEPLPTDVYERLKVVSAAVHEAEYDPCSFKDKNGKLSAYWDPNSKGIDDWLLSSRKPFE